MEVEPRDQTATETVGVEGAMVGGDGEGGGDREQEVGGEVVRIRRRASHARRRKLGPWGPVLSRWPQVQWQGARQ